MFESSESLISSLRLITGAGLLVGLILLLLGILYFRRSRRDTYWRQRRDAGRAGFRYAVLAMLAFMFSGATCLIAITISYVEDGDPGTVAEQPSPQATESITPALSSLTPIPTLLILSATPTPARTTIPAGESVTVEASPTPFATLPPTEIAILDTIIQIQAIDDVISDDWQPIQPDTNFTTAAQRLYVFFSYEKLSPGDIWGQVLLKDGAVLQRQSHEWGVAQPQGNTFFFFGHQNGFEAGIYEIQITVGSDEIIAASTRFTVVPE